MRHHSKNRTLGRTRKVRTGLMRGLAVSLIRDGKILTTEAKAKELRPFVERLVTYGKDGSVSARRRAASALGEPSNTVIQKLFGEIAETHKERQGGYTRIVKVGRSDGRSEAVIEFV